MIRIALPNKGALSEESINLLKEAGYRCRRTGRELAVNDDTHGIQFVFLRPRDIATYVGSGIVSAGITGRDLIADSLQCVNELLPLPFGESRFCYAVPAKSKLRPDQFNGLRIATSYPNIVAADLKKRGVKAQIIKLDGAVEISIELGVADAIADVVESGATIREAGLKIVGDPVMESEALLIANKGTKAGDLPEVKVLIDRVNGILVARRFAVIEYDIQRSELAAACELTPGVQSPTISELAQKNWVAVKSMIERSAANKVMDQLKILGAKGILLTDIRTCRL